MKKLYIFKTGSTFPGTKSLYGDFDDWTRRGFNSFPLEIEVIDIEKNDPYPEIESSAGIIVTGSHAFVTDNLSWSEKLADWLKKVIADNIPFLGICYGHQLLAKAFDGIVDFHPKGKEIGTKAIQLKAAAMDDPVFKDLPEKFLVHTTHSQSVLKLPEDAICIAGNDFEAHHAFRIGKCGWGIQFHPEYNTDIMKSYIREQKNELVQAGLSVKEILTTVSETPFSFSILEKFGNFVVANKKNKI